MNFFKNWLTRPFAVRLAALAMKPCGLIDLVVSVPLWDKDLWLLVPVGIRDRRLRLSD